MAALSGQCTVASAGTAVQLSSTSQVVMGPVAIKALAANSGHIFVGNDGSGDVTSSNGYELGEGEEVILDYVYDLNQIWVDAAENGDKAAWLTLKIM